MTEIVGVRFKKSGKIYYFDSSGLELEIGDKVVVETIKGIEMGDVVITDIKKMNEIANKPLKQVVRKANAQDLQSADDFKQKEGEAIAECNKLIEKLQLSMKIISAEYNVDGSRITIYFSAEGRIDFREMVRDLSRNLKVRVEMRQIGPRDEAKLLSGFGRCGRPLCCTSFLGEFNPVSIKMAKEQDLPLSPMKISGLCGRLLCCLDYEFDLYREMREKIPREGNMIITKKGEGIVVGSKPVEEKVLVELESGARIEVSLSEIIEEGKSSSKKKHSHKMVKGS
ncbi:MAG: stage 0 sporulation family protein [Dehalococcoidia bacterium]|nr:MAG: stage 0 sporulation family protein [Dehalococcoidia bacterium]